MVHYLYLIVFLDPGRKPVPAHWAVLITPGDGQRQGVKHHAVGSPFRGYQYEKEQHCDLEATDRPYTAVLLENIDDAWTDRIDELAASIAVPGLSSTPLDPFVVRQTHQIKGRLIHGLISYVGRKLSNMGLEFCSAVGRLAGNRSLVS